MKGRQRKYELDEVLNFIKDRVKRDSMPPTIREISKQLGISVSTAVLYLNRLERAGKIVRTPNIARGIRIVTRKRAKKEAAPQ